MNIYRWARGDIPAKRGSCTASRIDYWRPGPVLTPSGPSRMEKLTGRRNHRFLAGYLPGIMIKIKTDSNLIPHISIFALYTNPHFAAVSSETRDMLNRMIYIPTRGLPTPDLPALGLPAADFPALHPPNLAPLPAVLSLHLWPPRVPSLLPPYNSPPFAHMHITGRILPTSQLIPTVV